MSWTRHSGVALVTVVLGVAVMWLARHIGIALHPVVVPLAVVVAGLTAAVAHEATVPITGSWRRASRQAHRTTHDRQLSTLALVVHGLRAGRTWDRLSPQLLSLVAHRLQEHHGVDLEAQPETARTLLAPELRDLVDHPDRPPSTVRALDTIVTRIEEL